MDILTLLLLIIVVVLVVLVIQVRRKCVCHCPVDQKWLDEFNKWAQARDVWAKEVQDWIVAVNGCLNAKCFPEGGGVTPPEPPPCTFGSC